MEKFKKDVLKLKTVVDTQRAFGNTSKLYSLGQDDILGKVLKLVEAATRGEKNV